jgi:hypothetical protein
MLSVAVMTATARAPGDRRGVAVLVLGGLLLAMAGAQLAAPSRFAAVLADYRLLPSGSESVAAGVVITAEATAAALLLLTGRWRRSGAVLAVCVAVGWSVLGSVAFGRHLAVSNCGCFGRYLAQPLRWWVLVEDAEFVLLSVWVARRVSVHRSQGHHRDPHHEQADRQDPRVGMSAEQP